MRCVLATGSIPVRSAFTGSTPRNRPAQTLECAAALASSVCRRWRCRAGGAVREVDMGQHACDYRRRCACESCASARRSAVQCTKLPRNVMEEGARAPAGRWQNTSANPAPDHAGHRCQTGRPGLPRGGGDHGRPDGGQPTRTRARCWVNTAPPAQRFPAPAPSSPTFLPWHGRIRIPRPRNRFRALAPWRTRTLTKAFAPLTRDDFWKVAMSFVANLRKNYRFQEHLQ